jgi:hypothetical protein
VKLYGNHEGYVDKFNTVTDKMFKDGWVTKADMGLMKTEAAESKVLR